MPILTFVNLMHSNFPSKIMAIPPPPEPKSRPRTVIANRKQVVEYLQGLAAGSSQVVRQRVVLFGDSWFERFTYQGRNNGVRPFVKQVESCTDQGPNSVENNANGSV